MQGVVLNSNTKTFFFALIVASNAVFFIYWIIKAIQELRAKLRLRCEGIYLFFCLCSDKQKLEKEKAKQRIIDENEVLREEYMKSIKGLKELYNKGHIILNP